MHEIPPLCSSPWNVCPVPRTVSPLRMLKQGNLPLSHAHTERGERVAPAAAAQLVEQRHDEPSAAHPERMSDGDRAAVDVHLVLVEPELANHDEALGSERLVQLDEVDVGD